MIRPRFMKVLRDIWGNKTRTALVVASIAVGVFAVGTISGSKQLVAREMTNAYLAVHPSHATLFVDPFDDELVQAVRHIDGVAEAEGRRAVTVRAKVGEGWKDLELILLPDGRSPQISRIRPVEGSLPPRRDQVLIERGALGLLGTAGGNEIVVETPDRKPHTLRVSGVVHDLDQFPAFLAGRGYGYVSRETLERLGFSADHTYLQIRLAADVPDPKQVEEVAGRVSRQVERSGRNVFFTYIPKPGKHPADDAIQTFMLVLGVLGFISLLASGFLVINTIGSIIAQNVRQIGIMKAVGARVSQIAGLYVALVISYALLSLVVGVPMGSAGAYLFARFIAGLVNFDIVDPSVPSGVLLLEVAVGLLVPLLFSLVPVLAGARVTVREAISENGTASVLRHGRLDRLLEKVRFLSRPLLISLRNTFRRKGRLALTLITLTLSGIIFIGVFSVRSSLMLTLDTALQYFNYDLDVNMSRPYRSAEMERVALQVDGVAKVESWGFGSARRKRAGGTDGDSLQIVSPPAETELLKPTLMEGRWLVPEDENAVVVNSEVLKAEPDIKVGDWITLTIDDKETSWRVVGTVRSVMLGRIAYVNYPYYSRLVQRPGRSSGIRVVTEQHDPDFQEKVARALREELDQAGFRIAAIESMSSVRRQVAVQFDMIVLFMVIMAVLLATVGGLGLAGTMSINVLERTREIGVMRAIGASTGSMLKIFMVEGILITLISCLMAALLALPMSRLLADAVGMAFLQAPLNYSFSFTGLFLWLVVAAGIALVSSAAPSWRAARLTVRDVLAYE